MHIDTYHYTTGALVKREIFSSMLLFYIFSLSETLRRSRAIPVFFVQQTRAF